MNFILWPFTKDLINNVVIFAWPSAMPFISSIIFMGLITSYSSINLILIYFIFFKYFIYNILISQFWHIIIFGNFIKLLIWFKPPAFKYATSETSHPCQCTRLTSA